MKNKDYITSIMQNNELTKVEFNTQGNPVEFIWDRYGMDTYIEFVMTKEDYLTKENKEMEEV